MSLARRLLGGTFQLALSGAVVRLLSVITLPVLTGLLSPEAYGGAALVGTLISLMSVVALAGIDMSYARAYHSATAPSGTAVEGFSWRFAIVASSCSGVISGLVWYWVLAEWFALSRWFGLLLGLGIVFSVGSTMSQARARLAGSYARLSAATVIGGVASAIVSIGVAVWLWRDETPLLLAVLISYLIPLVVLGLPEIKPLLKKSVLASEQRLKLVKIGLAGVVTAPMYWVLSSLDRWFLGLYQGADAVGIYSVGYSIGAIGLVVNSAVISVWLPEASREYESDSEKARVELGRLMSRLVAGMALVWLAVTAAGGDTIRWLANDRFHAAADYVAYIAAGAFFYGVLHLANVGLLLSKRLNWAVPWWLLGSAVCILLNIFLVPTYGGIGAAFTQTVSFAVMAIGILYTSQQVYRMVIEWKPLAITGIMVCAFGIAMSPAWDISPLFSLLIKLPVGVLAVVLVAWLMADDWLVRGLAVMRRRIRN